MITGCWEGILYSLTLHNASKHRQTIMSVYNDGVKQMSVADLMAARTQASTSSVALHVYPFTDAMKAQVIPGKRLVVIRWKATKDKDTGKVTPAHAPMCVLVPQYTVVCTDGALQPMFQDAYNQQVDLLVRALMEEEMIRNYNLTSFSIPEEKVNSVSVVAFYEAENSGEGRGAGKLSSEQIKTWFEGSLADSLTISFMEKQGLDLDNPASVTPEKVKQIEQAVDRYKMMMCKLAAPKVSLKQNVLVQLGKALALGNEEDAMNVRLGKVINKAMQVQEEVLEDLL